jgi:hypothetical protein
MRNKILVEKKLERVERYLKNISFNVNRNQRRDAQDTVKEALEKIEEIQTLLNTETQDK